MQYTEYYMFSVTTLSTVIAFVYPNCFLLPKDNPKTCKDFKTLALIYQMSYEYL